MSGSADAALDELRELLDEGVHVAFAEPTAGSFVLDVRTDEGCADCLVPDETLQRIAADVLRRQGITVTSVTIRHDA